MPPDVLHRDRLQKVLQSLEAEAIAENLKSLKKETSDVYDLPRAASTDATSVIDSQVTTTSNDSARSEKVIPFNNYQYVDNGAYDLVWTRIAYFGTLQILHVLAVYLTVFYGSFINLKTWLFGYGLFLWSAFGVTAGAHRLWSHKSYQAKWPVRVFLMLGHCIAGQNTLYNWCRDHRVHHKYSETDSDPHNSKRGFFYAHVGWLLMRSHPDFIAQRNIIYAQDLLKDPVVDFQKRRYIELCMIVGLILPTFLPAFCWGESIGMAFLIAVVARYVTCLHNTWFVNSAAHMFGERPYNPRIEPRQNWAVSFGALGEGYHNYHHTYPWDYSTSESGVGSLNFTKSFIDLMYKFGLVYDRKVVHLRK